MYESQNHGGIEQGFTQYQKTALGGNSLLQRLKGIFGTSQVLLAHMGATVTPPDSRKGRGGAIPSSGGRRPRPSHPELPLQTT